MHLGWWLLPLFIGLLDAQIILLMQTKAPQREREREKLDETSSIFIYLYLINGSYHLKRTFLALVLVKKPLLRVAFVSYFTCVIIIMWLINWLIQSGVWLRWWPLSNFGKYAPTVFVCFLASAANLYDKLSIHCHWQRGRTECWSASPK